MDAQDLRKHYEGQVEMLKQCIRELEESNFGLSRKNERLEELAEKADQTIRDLNTAFKHSQNETLQIKAHSSSFLSEPAPPSHEDTLALEAAREENLRLNCENMNWISNKSKLTQQVAYLQRECERYRVMNMKLGKQVCHLTATLEEERGMIIRRHPQQQSSSKSLITVSDAIDEHLVTFKSIEELQQQNQNLLGLLTELSKNEEDRETRIENEDIKRLMAEIDDLKKQVVSIGEDRQRAFEALNNIRQERDLFKILLSKTRQAEHMTPEIFQRMVSIACSSNQSIAVQEMDTRDKDAHIKDLQAMISRLETKLVEAQQNQELECKKRDDELALKVKLLDEAHKKVLAADVLHQRNEVLETNYQKLSVDFEELRAQHQKLIFELNSTDKDAHIKDLQAMILSLENKLVAAQQSHELECKKRDEELALKAQLLEEANGKVLEADEIHQQNEVLEANYQKLSVENEELRDQNEKLLDELNSTDKDAQIEDLQATLSSLENRLIEAQQNHELVCNQRDSELALKVQQLEEAHRRVLEANVIHQRNEALEANYRKLSVDFEELHAQHQKLICELNSTDKDAHIKDLQSKISSLENRLLEAQQSQRLEIAENSDDQHRKQVSEVVLEAVAAFDPVPNPPSELQSEPQPMSEPISEAMPELVTDPEPLPEPVPELVSGSEHVFEPMFEPVTEPETEPKPEPTNELAPEFQSVSEHVPEPETVSKPPPEPTPEPEFTSTIVPEFKPMSESIPQLVPGPAFAPEAVPEPAVKPVKESFPKPTEGLVHKPAPEPAPQNPPEPPTDKVKMEPPIKLLRRL